MAVNDGCDFPPRMYVLHWWEMWTSSCTTLFTSTWWTTVFWPRTWRTTCLSHQCTMTWGSTSTTTPMGSVYAQIAWLNLNVYRILWPKWWTFCKIPSPWRLWQWTVPGSSMVTRWPQTVWSMSSIGSSVLWAAPSRKSWMSPMSSPHSVYVKWALCVNKLISEKGLQKPTLHLTYFMHCPGCSVGFWYNGQAGPGRPLHCVRSN